MTRNTAATATLVLLVATGSGCASTGPAGSAAAPASPTATASMLPQVPADRSHHVSGAVPAHCTLRHEGRDPLPDPRCTPGAVDPEVTQATIATTICVPGWTTRVRPSSSQTRPVKSALMAAYGVRGGNELDHLVSLELGGANDVRNLWPEPGTIPNPKDRVENALHKAVCEHRVTLTAAQQAIAEDWTTAEARLGLH